MGSVVSSSVPVEPNRLSPRFWEDGVSNIQQRARSMSQQFLDSNPVTDDTSLSGITSWLERMTNQAANRQDSQYQRQLNDRAYWAQQSASNRLSTDRTAFERQQALNQQNFNNQSRLLQQSQDNVGRVGGFSGARTYGPQGQISTSREQTLTSTGLRSGLYNPSITSEWLATQRTNAESARMFSEANAAGQSRLQREQYDYQRSMANLNNRNAIDLMNRETSINAQNRALERDFQSRENAAQRASAERIGAMDAQSKVYSSMFGAFSGGNNNNYQYWGGRV